MQAEASQQKDICTEPKHQPYGSSLILEQEYTGQLMKIKNLAPWYGNNLFILRIHIFFFYTAQLCTAVIACSLLSQKSTELEFHSSLYYMW